VNVATGVEEDATSGHALAPARAFDVRPGNVAEAARAFPSTRQEIVNRISTSDP
jgi:hypothetical protein